MPYTASFMFQYILQMASSRLKAIKFSNVNYVRNNGKDSEIQSSSDYL